jgi:acyl-CoA dehydrogenase
MPSSSVIDPRPGDDENWYREDPPLQQLLALHVDEATLGAAEHRLDELGELAPADLDRWAREADRHEPTLERRSPTGERVDRVDAHPAYENLRLAARINGVFTASWHEMGEAERAPRALTFALGYLYAQAEAGYYCPACMTDGAAFVLDRHAPEPLAERFVPRLVSRDPDEGIEGAMYLTEKEGGSDVGASTRTRARQAEDGTWRLTGEKWFASNCTAEVAMALARMPDGEEGTEGLGLFLVPRHLSNGSPNPGLHLERLKDKLGVQSMPTGEIVLDEAHAHLVQGAGSGFKAMAEMVNLSRLYNAVASVAVARRALREGQRAGRQRETFGQPLHEHALFLRDLVELTVDVEGGLALTLDQAEVFDRWAEGEEDARAPLRILTPCAKAMTAKLSVAAASEGCELLGGQGYIEEYVTPRLLRDAQVLPIWEGTTNIQALDLLRAVARDRALPGFLAHSSARLAEAEGHEGLEPAIARVREGYERIEQAGERLASVDRDTAEAMAIDLTRDAYHVHAAALLARRAAHRPDDDRAREVARLYAARHVAEDRSLGRRAVRQALADHGTEIAYPVTSQS